MLSNNISGQTIFTFRGTQGLLRSVTPGSLVRVEILGNGSKGATFIRLAGQIFSANNIPGYAKGDIFQAKVSFSGNNVLLHPVSAQSANLPAEFLSRLGIENAEIATCLVSFFQKINARIDGRHINSLIKTASRFPGKEERAAEASAILAERGIEPLYETVTHLIKCIEGKTGNGDGDGNGDTEQDFLAFINHKKGQDRHWIVVPFSKMLSGVSCSGSVRFLVDIATGKPIETRLTCFEGIHCWEFTLSGNKCVFTSDPAFKPVNFEKFVLYLKSIFLKSGITEISSYILGANPASVPKFVDLEI